MSVKWTDDQKKVIDTRQKNILVSAAAGSGKTAVLVERILTLVMDPVNPVDIDELLIVTFTRAAADEMRERIRNALENARRIHPQNRHLLRQMTLIHSASIMTIDSFCMQVVRNHFQEVDLDPAFRVGEDGELKLLMQDVLEELLEECYTEGREDFLAFSDCYAAGRSDKSLEKLILKMFQFAQSHPWPSRWLNDCRHEENQNGWMEDLKESLVNSIRSYCGYANTALEVCLLEDGPYMYESAVRSDLKHMDAMLSAKSFEDLRACILAYKPERLSAKKDASVSEVKKETVKAIREKYKKSLDNLKKKYFFQSAEEAALLMEKAKDAVNCLVELTEAFQERYLAKKKDRNLVDFSDLEHYALEIFLKEENGQYVQTDTARAYAAKYKEIFIDEYQDSNLVQEILLNSISGETEGIHNLFMVGDVKQSIYSFRLARPELFIDKYHRYGAGEEGCVRIDLKQNFRSRSKVLTAVNSIFKQIMQPDLGSIAYDEAASLYPGMPYPGKDPNQEIFLLEAEQDGAEDAIAARELEAKMCADRIHQLLKNDRVKDKETGELRPVRHSDIVILLRTMDGWADVFQEVLEQEGIPCRTTLRSGYFSSYEIQTILNMLRIIDNPKQDIPLTSVLRSIIGEFSDEDLAKIRCVYKTGSFYEACEWYRDNGPEEMLRRKVQAFYQQLSHFREMVAYTPIHQLIWNVLDETGFEAYVSAMPGGVVRRANLAMLADKAIAFEKTSYKGVFHFIRYIDRMIRQQVDYGEADVTGERPESVEIQSIHKSKGLEYPIVIVAGMGKKFNEMDARSSVVLHMEYGVGIDYVDPQMRLRMPTLKKRAIQRRMRQELLGEELRVLYVAMTRAKEKLIMTGTVKSLKKELTEWYAETGNPLPVLTYETRLTADSYLDFVMPTLLRNRCAGFLLRSYDMGILKDHPLYEERFGITLFAKSSENLVWHKVGAHLKRQERLTDWSKDVRSASDNAEANFAPAKIWKKDYPWRIYDNLPVKLSVSELKKQQTRLFDEEAVLLYEEEEVMPLIPAFMEEKHETAGSVRGDAYHRFMEVLDFSVEPAKDAIESAAESYIRSGRYTEEEFKLVEVSDIEKMLSSSLGRRMASAAQRNELRREQPFVIGIPAEDVRRSFAGSGEQILIQGIIDAFFYEDGDIVLMDYKTDRLYKEEAFAERYRVQLEYYKKALEQLTGRHVKEIYIYSFTLGKEISL